MDSYQEGGDIFGDDDDAFDINTPIVDDSILDGPLEPPMPEPVSAETPNGLPTEMPKTDEDPDLAGFLGEEMDGDMNLDNNFLNTLEQRELEIGEKADDAVDYGEISDDDLPDDEPVGGPVQSSYQPMSAIEDAAMTGGTPDGPAEYEDDLFGESSPYGGDGDLGGFDSFGPGALRTGVEAADAVDTPAADHEDDDDDKNSLASEHQDDSAHPASSFANNLPADTEDASLYLMQMALFGGEKIPETEEENMAEWVRTEFPNFDNKEIPYITRLFPPRKSRWLEGKAPQKPPKPIRPTKVTLEIEPDQRLLFNSAGVANLPEARGDIVHALQPSATAEESDMFEDSDDGEPLPGGYTMQDLEFMCTEFDTLSHAGASDIGDLAVRIADEDEMVYDDERHEFEPAQKKRKIGLSARDIITRPAYPLPASYDHFEQATATIAAKPILDLNDTNLLLEEVDPDVATAKSKPGAKSKGPQTVANKLFDRFNTSNDAEYDLLKQNHQHKVRGQLGHTTIDHSMPAIRLQYPYFPVQLSVQELRNWHRKKLHFRGPFTFSKPPRQKRKAFKGKETKEIFSKSRDLSLGDNSTAALFEYSEEHPTMLSSTGMGNKVVNYYRRKTADDSARPKHDVGELNVLLPEDKSPFNQFGHIDGGEEITALVNSMYKAPVFEQSSQPEDFLVVRETTGLDGQRYYIRAIDNTFVVGQELPTKTVPGIHSRNVTSASKFRLRSIAYRIVRRRKTHRLRVEDVTKHFPDTTDMQNRQKMKEFMTFNKEAKEWEMAKGNPIPTEEVVQSLLRPEDIALLEAKDVGAQYLRDAGYVEDDYDEDKDNQAGTESTEQLLAPWRATKNFVLANQGKAMLTLHGEGDPSGRGEAYSFLKTSMKGGFRAQGAPVADTVQAKKELGGHSYNVAKQQRDYDESIRKIWNKQKDALSSKLPPSDPELEGDVDTQEDNMARQSMRATPSSTPAPGRRGNDDTASTISRNSQGGKKWLRITRTVLVNGRETQTSEVVSDPAIIKAYIRRKEQLAANNLDISNLAGPSGNADLDARNEERIRAEIARLEANQARNKKRASKKAAAAGSPDGATSPDGDGTPAGKQTQPTLRKCANCGQVGHIKTNKKLCPLLNGTMKQDDVGKNKAFMGMAPPPLG